jgi:pyruvate-formate lyase
MSQPAILDPIQLQPGEPYYHLAHQGPDCSTERSAHLRERVYRMSQEKRTEPPEYTRLAEEARRIFLENEEIDPSLARAKALYHIVENCEIALEDDLYLLGGENPFFFNLLLPTLQADHYSRNRQRTPDEASRRLRDNGMYTLAYFEGHITPGLENVFGQGIGNLYQQVEEYRQAASAAPDGPRDRETEHFYEAALLSCESVLLFAHRYREAAEAKAQICTDPQRASQLRKSAEILSRVPEEKPQTFREALQAYWLLYTLVTLEMGGASPGGGLGLGRPDQYLYPFYAHDLRQGRMSRPEALELMEEFLLAFNPVDYYTPHQICTTGSQASLGGVTPAGGDAFNDLSELIMEASLRINMPTPYISLRLYQNAPERFWSVASNYITSGLGFPVVNDEALIPAMLRHGRSLGDARDYICSCCYEHTIPGREAFHPSCCFVNLGLILELALNQGRSVLSGESLGVATPAAVDFKSFEDVLAAFQAQIHFVFDRLVVANNFSDQSHSTYRRYPLMSLFISDCLAKAKDVCAGGARYNLTGCVVGGLPNVVNSLGAIRECVFEKKTMSMAELIQALRSNFEGSDTLRRKLLDSPKWANDNESVDELAGDLADRLYAELAPRRNPRGGRWQLALYTFITNHWMGNACGASADGRLARQLLTRNLDPTWGTDRKGPTAVLNSLGHIDFSTSPDGSSLNLRFDPAMFRQAEGREKFIGFLKSFVDLGVMEMQITVVDTETLLDARAHPELYPWLMVRVAGYSARFIELSPEEQEEVIRRSMQSF